MKSRILTILLGLAVLGLAALNLRLQARLRELGSAPSSPTEDQVRIEAAPSLPPTATAQGDGPTTALAEDERARHLETIRRLEAELAALRGAATPENPATEASPPQDVPRVPPMAAMMSRMMDSPEYQKAMEAERRMSLEKRFSGLFDYLELSEPERDQLLALLAERHMGVAAAGARIMTEGIRLDKVKEQREALHEAWAGIDADIERVLGEERAAKYKRYMETEPDRYLVDALSERLLPAEGELTAEQQLDLTFALYEERTGFQFSQDLEDKDNLSAESFSKENLDRHFEEVAQLHARYIERARALLAPPQLQKLEQTLELQRHQERAGMEMLRSMFSQPPPAAPAPPPAE